MGTVHTLPSRRLSGPPEGSPEEDVDAARARIRADMLLLIDRAIAKLQMDETPESERRAAAREMIHAVIPLLGRAVEIVKPHRLVAHLLSAILVEVTEEAEKP